MSDAVLEDLETTERETDSGSSISGDLTSNLGMMESEALSNLGVDKSNYTIEYNSEVKIRKIIISEPVKKGRTMTMRGLTKSVSELGVVTPIHVMRLESADLADDEDDEDVPEFQLIKGTRRLFASIKNGLETIPCIVWDFKDKDKGRKAALVLGLTLNRSQKRSWSEVWDLYGILEMQSQIKPATFESLFQLEGGDAMKLKDVMFSEYAEIKDDLLANEKSLDQCYKQLQKLRKDEDRLEIEDNTGFSDTNEEAKEVVDETEKTAEQLSNDEVMDLLEMGESFGKDVGSKDFSDMNGMFNEPTVQKVGDRKPVDPVIKQQTFARDDYTCICCGTHGKAFLATLIFHHIVPVHAGGPDTVENGLTLCDSCHIMLHVIEREGRLPITEDEFNKYEFVDQLRIKNILHYARIAIIAGKRKGLSQEDRKKFAKSGTRHRMPGEGYTENKNGYALFQQKLDEVDEAKTKVK